MGMQFAEFLKKIRAERGLSQREIAEQMYVTRSTVARWESGSRMPDAVMVTRLAKYLDVNTTTLLSALEERNESPNVIMVDDRKIVLNGGLPVLREAMPNATVVGFTRPSDALEYARANRVSLAFLDIELGKHSGLDLCQEFLDISPRTNVVFLTAFSDYSLEAWDTGASGFMLKPLTLEGVQNQLKHLRYPFTLGGVG